MKKKLMAVAVAGALAAPAMALAQASNVQIYGRVNAGLDNYSATGATAGSNSDLKSRYRVFDQGSKLGFRGSEDLGGGMKALFLMESGVNVDNGGTTGQGGQANAFTGTFASRYGHVDLAGKWGQIGFGKYDVYWGNGLNDRVTSTYTEAGVSWTTMGRGMSTGISRQNNTMQYTSPTFNGFNAVVSYSPNSQEAVQSFTTQGGAAQTNTDGKLWGLSLNMNMGQFVGGIDYVKVQLNSLPNPTSTGAANANCLTTAAGVTGLAGANCTTPENQGTKIRGGWMYQPGAQISFIYNKNSAKNWSTVIAAAGATTAQGGLFTAGDGTITQDVYGFSWEHTWGNIHVMAQWNKYRDAKGCQGVLTATGQNLCAGTNATGQTLAARYLLSKRTDVYVNWSTYRNGSAYNNDYTYAGVTSSNPGAAGLAVGADPRFFAVGVSHWF